MEVISLEDAKASGLKFFFTGEPCRNGHVAERYIGYTATCIECSRDRDAKRISERKIARESRKKSSPNMLAREAAMKAGSVDYSTGVPCAKGHTSTRYVSDGKCVACHCAKIKLWKSKNTAKVSARRRERDLRKTHATPPWLTNEHRTQIEAIYLQAQIWTEVTGVLYHVDHIIPLNGKTVCGLHVPWNLRAITAKENIRKSNRIDVL